MVGLGSPGVVGSGGTMASQEFGCTYWNIQKGYRKYLWYLQEKILDTQDICVAEECALQGFRRSVPKAAAAHGTSQQPLLCEREQEDFGSGALGL